MTPNIDCYRLGRSTPLTPNRPTPMTKQAAKWQVPTATSPSAMDYGSAFCPRTHGRLGLGSRFQVKGPLVLDLGV